jgi:hypothetical protein
VPSTNDVSSVIINRADNINTVIVTSMLLLLASFLLRLMKKDEVEIPKVKVTVKLSYLPYIMIAMTVAHLYTSYSFNVKVDDVINGGSINDAQQSFKNLSDNGPLFFQGLMARLKIVEGPAGPIFAMDEKDPSTWLAYGAALGAFITLIMVRWSEGGTMRRTGTILLSGVIVISNWLIGGGWAVHASCLNNIDLCKHLGI